MTARIRDVTLRDGLQDQARVWPLDDKIALATKLVEAGVTWIELTSFVNPKVMPQFIDAAELCAAVQGLRGRAMLSAFTATPRGATAALEAGIDEISVAVPATDAMSQANFRRTTAQMLEELRGIRALEPALPMSATVAVAFGCPLEGEVKPGHVLDLVDRLVDFGYETIFLGDTVGVSDPGSVRGLVGAIRDRFPAVTVGLHLHDARGSAVAGVVAGVEAGAALVDASLAGLGGCPFAPGARGNVATEDISWTLRAMGYDLGFDPFTAAEVAKWVARTGQVASRSHLADVRPFDWEVGGA